MKSKRGEEILWPNIAFLILNVLFYGMLFAFVANSSDMNSNYEKAYARQIGLMIDQASPGAKISLDITNLLARRAKNMNIDSVVTFDNVKKEITVKLGTSQGYGFSYFTNANIKTQIKTTSKSYILVMELEK